MKGKASTVPQWHFMGASLVLSLAVGMGYRSMTAQTTVLCPQYVGLQATGCTAFGYNDDDTVRSWGILLLQSTSYNGSRFCQDIWGFAGDWMDDYMQGVFSSATLDGRSLDAFSGYNSFGWTHGWLKESWLRDYSKDAATRGYRMRNAALHEGAHRACDESDWGSCDSSDEDEVDNAVDQCLSQN